MEAVRERLRGHLWSAKFEGWIAQQIGPDVDHKYQMLVRMLPIQTDYFPTPGYLAKDVRFRGVEDFEQNMYQYFVAWWTCCRKSSSRCSIFQSKVKALAVVKRCAVWLNELFNF